MIKCCRLLARQREKKQLEESLAELKEQDEEMSRANRALTVRLEDIQVRLRNGAAQCESIVASELTP